MTETRGPKPCHYDRHYAGRVTAEHRDDCPNPAEHRGCAPCTAPHCTLCQRRHLDNDHPLTCTECIGQVREDLTEILWLCRHLRWQAARGGRDGRLVAAAPLPGGDALALYARAGVVLEDMRTYPGFTLDNLDKDHHLDDVVPVLLPLIAWDTRVRHHYGHQLPARPSVAGITHYLADRLTDLAQDVSGGVDWLGFTRDIAALRRQIEGVLHDEQEPERGVGCFECGDRLVRRFGKPKPCRHRTPGRERLAQVEADAETARERLAVLASYPELGPPTYADLRAARRTPTSAELSAARIPCAACSSSTTGQGGIEDPSVGQSWECLGCRKKYTPGEYAHAVRRDLLEAGPDGDGWTHITMAAEAASTQTGQLFPPATVRRWMDRTKVASVCRWSYSVDGAKAGAKTVPEPVEQRPLGAIVAEYAGRVQPVTWGQRLVYWPDVADQAARAVQRAFELAEERRQRAIQFEAWSKRVASGMDPKAAGERLGIHPQRVARFVEEFEQATSKESA